MEFVLFLHQNCEQQNMIMKTRTLSLLFAFFLVGILSAQNNDSIRQLIMNQKDTDLQLLAKGRSLIIEQLSKGDITGLRDTKDYLIKEMGEPYKVFTVGEYWLLSFWTEEYSTILLEVDKFTRSISKLSRYESDRLFYISPLLRMISENDELHKKLAIKSAESYLPLSVYIDNAELNSEEKEFLKLFLFSMLFTSPNHQSEEMEEVNSRATAFLEAYPESNYADYTRRYIRYKYEAGNWGLGYEFALGYGNTFGQLHNNFGDGVGIGLEFEVLYKQAHFQTRFHVLSSKTRNDITVNGLTWPGNTVGNFFTADFAFQYPAFMNKKIKLMPFVGIGAVGVSPVAKVVKDYPELEDFKTMSAFSYFAGVDFRFNFWNKTVNLSKDGGLYVNLRYSYYFPNYGKKYDFMAGNLHLITLGVGGFTRPILRKL